LNGTSYYRDPQDGHRRKEQTHWKRSGIPLTLNPPPPPRRSKISDAATPVPAIVGAPLGKAWVADDGGGREASSVVVLGRGMMTEAGPSSVVVLGHDRGGSPRGCPSLACTRPASATQRCGFFCGRRPTPTVWRFRPCAAVYRRWGSSLGVWRKIVEMDPVVMLDVSMPAKT
jgi:hypothetical protein